MQVIVHILNVYKENNIKKDKKPSMKIPEYILSLCFPFGTSHDLIHLFGSNWLVVGPTECMKSKLATGRIFNWLVLLL
jgi:ATP-dependent protease Clp ATPase subunit